jgi:dGTPase
MEVARVARTLGQRAGQRLAGDARARALGPPPAPEDLGHLCAAAAAAHDLGTPPFAHVGEQAISDFFKRHSIGRRVARDVPGPIAAEITAFEGNAQGFRDLARLQGWRRNGGLNLTCATLAAHAKYPYRADAPADVRLKGRKYGHLAEDAELFEQVAEETGLVRLAEGVWARHPAAHLVEAADDVCYSIVDLEDAARLGVLPQDEAEDLIRSVSGDPGVDLLTLDRPADRLACLRSKAISRLVDGVVDVFIDQLDAILAGRHPGDLVAAGPHAAAMDHIARISRSRIYKSEARTRRDLAASAAIERILGDVCRAFLDRRDHGASSTLRHDRTIALIPGADRLDPANTAGWVRAILDWLAARTDDEAMETAGLLAAAQRGRAA